MITKLWKYYQGSKTVSTLKDESILLGKWQMLKHKYWVKWSQQKSQIIIKLLLNYLHVILFSLLQVTSTILPSPKDRIPVCHMVNFLHSLKWLKLNSDRHWESSVSKGNNSMTHPGFGSDPMDLKSSALSMQLLHLSWQKLSDWYLIPHLYVVSNQDPSKNDTDESQVEDIFCCNQVTNGTNVDPWKEVQ